ncbi:MAG: hypothetical protein ACI89L_000493 [Phycisphaerales bacterium]
MPELNSGVLEPPQLAVSLAGLSRREGVPWAGSPKATLAWLAETAHAAGVRSAVLDATRPGFRPRELDTGGRRDLAGALRRGELGFAGVDVFLPPLDFVDPKTLDRAVGAVLGAIGLAADLAGLGGGGPGGGGRVVSLVLPEDLDDDVRGTIHDEATRQGVRIADHAWPITPGDPQGVMLAGLDPVRVLEAGESPAKAAARFGGAVAAARLADRDETGRCAVGAPGARLEVLAYAAALATVGMRSVTIDLRGLHEPAEAIGAAATAWADVFRLPG